MYLDEYSTPYQNRKKEISYKFRTILQEEKDFQSIGEVYRQYSLKFKLIPSSKQILVNFNRARDINFVESFKKILSIYVKNFLEVYSTIQTEYQKIIPELLGNTSVVIEERPIQNPIFKKNLKRLQFYAPDLFVGTYPRKANQRYPLIINPEERDQWENKSFNFDGKVYNYQVMEYPNSTIEPDRQNWLFVCPIKKDWPNEEWANITDAPFPGLIKSDNSMSNYDQYSYLPKCYTKDQLDKKSGLHEYLSRTKPIIKERLQPILTGSKILDKDRYGQLEDMITTLLGSQNYKRLGIQMGINSLIQCLITAHSSDQKSLIIRREIAEEKYINAGKQELYQFTNQQIGDILFDNKIYLDYKFYYRLLEEFYNINIYVFTINDKQVEIEIPHGYKYNLQTFRNRNSVLIYKNTGTKIKPLLYPHYELIVYLNEDTRYVHNKSINNLIYETREKIYKNNWFIFESKITFGITNYGNIDIYQWGKPISQNLDRYGRICAVNYSDNQGKKYTIATFPIQPEFLPIESNYYETTYLEAINKLGKPTSYNIEGNLVIGIWFSYNKLDDVLYVPVKSFPSTKKEFPEGESSPLNSPDKDILYERLNKLYNDQQILLQLILWLFILDDLNPNFINDRVVIKNTIEDTANYYNFNLLPSSLPVIDSYQDAIPFLLENAHSMIYQNKVKIPSLKMRDGIDYYLRLYQNTHSGLEVIPPIELNISSINIINRTNSLILSSEEELINWFVYRSQQLNFIVTEIDSKYSQRYDPYLMKIQEKYYIIQNVLEGSLNRAIEVSSNWIKERINTGFDTKGSSQQVKTRIYISPNKIIQEGQIEILLYPNGNYAAMLSLN